MFARSAKDDLSEPARIARTVGGSTARKERRKMSSFDELPGCSCSRSSQALMMNSEGDSNPSDCVRKYLSNISVLDGL